MGAAGRRWCRTWPWPPGIERYGGVRRRAAEGDQTARPRRPAGRPGASATSSRPGRLVHHGPAQSMSGTSVARVGVVQPGELHQIDQHRAGLSQDHDRVDAVGHRQVRGLARPPRPAACGRPPAACPRAARRPSAQPGRRSLSSSCRYSSGTVIAAPDRHQTPSGEHPQVPAGPVQRLGQLRVRPRGAELPAPERALPHHREPLVGRLLQRLQLVSPARARSSTWSAARGSDVSQRRRPRPAGSRPAPAAAGRPGCRACAAERWARRWPPPERGRTRPPRPTNGRNPGPDRAAGW